MQALTNNFYLSVHFLVTTRSVIFNTCSTDGSWKGRRKGLEIMELKVFWWEYTMEDIMMIKDAQREKGTITWTGWLQTWEKKPKHIGGIWALLTFEFHLRNIDFYSSVHYKELSSWFRTKPQHNPQRRIAVQWQGCTLGYAVQGMYLCACALIITERKKKSSVCTFTEIFKISVKHKSSEIQRCYPKDPLSQTVRFLNT